MVASTRPPLIEAADTGPFFHTNAFATIEDAIGFYSTPTFNSSPAGTPNINMTATEIANVGRFLRVLNAAFNVQLAIARLNGAIPVIQEHKNHFRELQQTLASLALAETTDALAVLGAVTNLNASAQADLLAAQGFLQVASTHASHTQRLSNAQSALSVLNSAYASLRVAPVFPAPDPLAFTMGEGTLMF